jgi:hypothetical protein
MASISRLPRPLLNILKILGFWFFFGALVQLAQRGGYDRDLADLGSVVSIGFFCVLVVYCTALLFRWVRSLQAHRSTGDEKDKRPQQPQEISRWDALLRYDTDIRAASEKLKPYGDHWIDELRKAFVALSEDKSYLPSIVDRLSHEAETDRNEGWLAAFGTTQNGEQCSPESKGVLRQAREQGYLVEIEVDRTFVIRKGNSSSFMRSNYEIMRYGKATLGIK